MATQPPAMEAWFQQLNEHKSALEELRQPPAPPPPPPLAPDGDGGSSIPPMEARLRAVENAVTTMGDRLVHIDREVSQTKWWLAGSTIAIILAMVAAVLGTGVAIQQMTVATFQAAAQQQAPAPSPVTIQIPGLAVPLPAASAPR